MLRSPVVGQMMCAIDKRNQIMQSHGIEVPGPPGGRYCIIPKAFQRAWIEDDIRLERRDRRSRTRMAAEHRHALASSASLFRERVRKT